MTHIFSGSEREAFGVIGGVVSELTGAGYDGNYARGCLVLDANSGGSITTPAFSASYTTFWLHFCAYVSANPDNRTIFVLYNDVGTAVFRLQSPTAAQYKFEYWNGSAWVQLGSVWTCSAGVLYTLDLKVVCGASGSFEFYVGGSLFTSGSASMTSVNNINKFMLSNFAGTNQATRISEVIARDTTTIGMRLESETATGNGADIDGVGGFGDIDELATSDSDVKLLPTSGNRASFTSPARTQGGVGQKVYAVTVTARAFSDSNQSIKFYLTIGGTRYYSPPQLLAGVITGYQYSWETNPATGSTWAMSAAQAANLEWGYEVV